MIHPLGTDRFTIIVEAIEILLKGVIVESVFQHIVIAVAEDLNGARMKIVEGLIVLFPGDRIEPFVMGIVEHFDGAVPLRQGERAEVILPEERRFEVPLAVHEALQTDLIMDGIAVKIIRKLRLTKDGFQSGNPVLVDDM